jgi:phage repressor protein C with HTH and peptisase S24 domain
MTSDDLETPGGRLRWARERAGFPDATQFAKALKMNPVTYRAYENDQNGYTKHLVNLAARLNVPAKWLQHGGPIPETDAPEPPTAGEFGTPEILSDRFDIELVRQVDISYAMGDGAIVEDYPETGFLPFNRNFLQQFTRAPVERLFLATGQGDSMFPTLLRDDMLLIDTSQQRVAEQDRIWALTYAGAGMVKRLRRLPKDRFLILSDNPAVPPQEAEPDDVHIVGKLVWVGRRM